MPFILVGYYYPWQKGSTLMMEMVGSSEKLMTVYQTTRRHIPEDSNLHENLSYKTMNGYVY
jgi:hypothetical protein